MHQEPLSLDPQETNDSTSTPEPSPGALDDRLLDIRFRHSGWALRRQLVFRAMLSSGASLFRINRFVDCGADAYVCVDHDDPTHVSVRSLNCHDRFCVPCNVARGRRLAVRLTQLAADRTIRFITLTLAHTPDPLRDRLTYLYRSFRRLRAHPDWRAHVTGGVAFTELKLSHHTNCWHVHLHVLAQGTYFPKAHLSNAWQQATKGSYIVDITKPRRTEHVTDYVVKYVTKPLDFQVFKHPLRGPEVLNALHGTRMCTTFGNWRGYRLNDVSDPIHWRTVCSLATLRQRASQHDQDAQNLYDLLQKHTNLTVSHRIANYLARDPPGSASPSTIPALPIARSVRDPYFLDWLRPMPMC